MITTQSWLIKQNLIKLIDPILRFEWIFDYDDSSMKWLPKSTHIQGCVLSVNI